MLCRAHNMNDVIRFSQYLYTFARIQIRIQYTQHSVLGFEHCRRTTILSSSVPVPATRADEYMWISILE